MPEDKINRGIKKILENIDNYKQTLEAIICFSHVIRWDDENMDFKSNTYSFIARRMDTSKVNRINPENTIIPDLVLQLNEEYGILSEAKISFPRNREHWKDDFEQLQKYDDDLKGWKTENELIDNFDIILLTHYRMKVHVSDYLSQKKELIFNKNFAVIAFHRDYGVNYALALEKGYGNLTDVNLDEKFRTIVFVPLNKVIPRYPIKFYDVKPNVAYTMEILWTRIFNQYPQMEEFMESKGIKIIEIRVNIDDLTERLRTQFSDYHANDERQFVAPKRSWVIDAMEMFVKLNYAINNEEQGNYIIKYKNLVNHLKRFIEEIYELKRTPTLLDFIEKN
ncbi:MAG: hypothetical protein CEE43_02795 [Promethearchaeota archaeon Loki_b32]|nr:MAG: hypothetical protein CEE43_02795 [Candidatus Lokiarchaeota archaeon Loki_b32]